MRGYRWGVAGRQEMGLQVGKRLSCRVAGDWVAGWVHGGLQGGRRLVNDLDYGVGVDRWPGDQ